ncbi:hypothetical protein [Cytobacillus citreus]|nr:hypothetical protein [Cytobacillus citreus]
MNKPLYKQKRKDLNQTKKMMFTILAIFPIDIKLGGGANVN